MSLSLDMQLAKIFDQNLSFIKKIVDEQCRRLRLITEDCEDLFSSACVKLIENNFKKLRALEKEFSVSYLTKVVVNITTDIMREISGRWRPSEMGKKRGVIFIKMEELVCRDRYPFDEAYETIKMTYPDIKRDELFTFYQEITRELKGRPKDVKEDECLDSVPSAEKSPEDKYIATQDTKQGEIIRKIISETIDGLDDQTILAIRMRFNGGLSISEIARVIDQPRFKVEEKIKRALSLLKEKILSAGLRVSDVISNADSIGTFRI